MKHLVARLVFLFVCSATVSVEGAVGIYNSSEACLRGSDRTTDLEIDCNKTQTPGLVSVRRIFHGLTPSSMKCSSFNSPASSCCPGYNVSRDCLFPIEGGSSKLRKNCDGFGACFPNLDVAPVGDACPPRDGGKITYNSLYSFFAFVEYGCIGSADLADLCEANLTLQDTELYLERNVYHRNTNHFNKTCSCTVSTECGHRLVFHAFDLDLADDQGQCVERIVLTDAVDSSISASLNCSDNGVGVEGRTVGVGEEKGSVFVSLNNVVNFQLQLLKNGTGKILIRVTASGGFPVQVRCGMASEQDNLDNNNCPPVTATIPTPTNRTTPTTAVAVTSPSTATPNMSPITTTSVTSATTSVYNAEISDTAHNTGEVCVMGTNLGLVEIACSQSLILVQRLLHGSPPDSMHCTGFTSPASSCCPGYNASRDCLFSTEEGLPKLRENCDGLQFCSINLGRAAVGEACPDREGGRVTFPDHSTFAIVEYTCINNGLMTDVCAIGRTVRQTELYLETNVFHDNKDHANKTCSCTISTQCGSRTVFHAFDLDLAEGQVQGQCVEKVVLADAGNSSISASLDCDDNDVDEKYRGVAVGEEEGSVFVSHTNVVNFELQLLGSNTGKMLIRVTATDGTTVEVRCGSTASQDVWKEHQCPVEPTTSPPPTTAAEASTMDRVKLERTPEGGSSKLNTGAIAGVIVAAVLICLIIFILIILIWRSRRKAESEGIEDVIRPHRQDDPNYGQISGTHRLSVHSYMSAYIYDEIEDEKPTLPAEPTVTVSPQNGVAVMSNPLYYSPRPGEAIAEYLEPQGAVGGIILSYKNSWNHRMENHEKELSPDRNIKQGKPKY